MRTRVRVLATVGVLVVVAASAILTLLVLNDGTLNALLDRVSGRTDADASGTASDSSGNLTDPGPGSLAPLDATAVAPLPSGDSSAAIAHAEQPRTETPVTPRTFDVDAAMADVRALAAFGARGGGSAAEAKAAEYLAERLATIGLDVRIEEFELSNGTTSRNVIARAAGTSEAVVVLGGHYDTKPPSPGANDNATGCAALLEIATILTGQPAVPTVEFVFFGSEEVIGSDPNDHHFGSRYRVSQMSDAELAATVGMISVDMIGYGPDFHSRTMGRGPMLLSDMLLARARELGIRMTYRRDPGATGWSDHEAYELAGVPVSWIEWRDDPVYHTAGDTAEHVSQAKVAAAGTLVLEFVRGLDEDDLAALLVR